LDFIAGIKDGIQSINRMVQSAYQKFLLEEIEKYGTNSVCGLKFNPKPNYGKSCSFHDGEITTVFLQKLPLFSRVEF